MTGEITLSGRVLPVGGIKEKVLAAKRLGFREVIMPRQNEKNFMEDLTPPQRQDLVVHFVDEMDEVLALALTAPAKAEEGRRDELRPPSQPQPQPRPRFSLA
jgi:ATP-dependent Lon protease